MNNAQSSEELRKITKAFDNALESKDLSAILERFSEDCEIDLLNVKLFGKEGARKLFNWIFEHIAAIEFFTNHHYGRRQHLI